jgi:hypothetical protein
VVFGPSVGGNGFNASSYRAKKKKIKIHCPAIQNHVQVQDMRVRLAQ